MFFPPPTVIKAEVFSRIPDDLRAFEKPVFMHGAIRDSCIEGPSFDKAGNLYCVDIVYGRIYRFSPDGTVSQVLRYDGHPNGLKFNRDGIGFIADAKNGLMRFDRWPSPLSLSLHQPLASPFAD